MNSDRKTSTYLLLILLFSMFQAHAQTGVIKGIVRDAGTNETIPGANIVIEGTTTGASSNLDGEYMINYAPIGRQHLIVSCISYQTDTIFDVIVTKGISLILDIRLKEVALNLEGVTITARKSTSTDISMISTIKQSSLIINGVSAMQIAKTQDKDASEVIKRVPGITIMEDRFVNVRGLTERYSSVWLNNAASPSTETDQRAFSFDVIPSNLIDNILVFKTPAPELPADFAGATIQIFTRNTTEENQTSISYQVGLKEGTTLTNFYGYKGGNTDFLGFDDGTRKLPDAVPSTKEMFVLQDFSDGTPPEVIAARKEQLTEIARSFNKTSTAESFTAPFDSKLSIDWSRAFKIGKHTLSNISSLNYKYGLDYTQVERATYEVYDTVKDQRVYIYHHFDDRYAKNNQIGGIMNWSLSGKKSVYEFRNLLNQLGTSRTTIRNGIDYYRDASKVKSYELGYSSRTIYSGQLSGSHKLNKENLLINWAGCFSYANRAEPDVRRIYTVSARVLQDTVFVYLPYRLDYASTVNTESNGRLFSRTRENIYTGSVNMEYKLLIGSWQPAIKAGFYVEHKTRSFSLRTFGIAKAVIDGQFDRRILYQSLDSLYADTNFNFFNGIKMEENTAPEYSYDASNSIYAAYLGLKIPIGGFMQLYGGIRAESFNRYLGGFQSEQSTDPDIRFDTINIYPSANLTINITNRSLFRLSYGATVNRPEYREIAPYAFYDFEQSATVYGNPDLKDSYIQNLDLRFEFYPTPAELINLGIFYKRFKDPIEMNLFPASNGWDFVPVNSIRATNYGAEIELRKNFTALRGESVFARFIKDLTFSFNGAYIVGTVEKDDDYVRDKKRALFGQSPYIINAGLFYQNSRKGWSASVLYNLFGKRIVIVGTPTIPNIYEISRNLLDLTVSKKLGQFSVKVGAKNILDEPVVYRQTFLVDPGEGEVERTQDIRKFYTGRSYYVTVSYSF